MINLGEAPEQKVRAVGPIPKRSIVKVKLEIREPKTSDHDPAVTIFSSQIRGLDCEFTVVSGSFEGCKIWENLFLPPQMQAITLTKGQEGMCNAGWSKCRAIVESVRGIDPADPAGNRAINSWFDLHGLEFPVMVGIDKPKAGDKFVNNNITKILVVSDPDHKVVMSGGEIITDEPLPVIQQSDTDMSQQTRSWGKQGQQAEHHEQQPNPQQSQQTQTVSVPKWAQGKK